MTGKEKDLDFIIANDLIGSGFQPENALKVLEKGWKLTYFSYDSTIKEYIKKAEKLLKDLNIKYEDTPIKLEENLEDIKQFIDKSEETINKLHTDIEDREKEIEDLTNSIDPIEHLKNVPVELEKLYNLKYMNFRFGFLSTEIYEQVSTDIDDVDALLFEVDKSEDITWIIYFTPDILSEKVDSYFKVMKFKRIWLPEDFKGTPNEVINKVKQYISDNTSKIELQKNKLT